MFYAARRKLQEIIFKTRKFKYKKIYFNLEMNIDYEPYKIYSLYHPKNTPIYATWDFDKYVLQNINCKGFFSVDFGDAIDGGELFLIKPSDYLSLYMKSEKTCYKKDAFENVEFL
jgi:hypothetical protein